MKRGMKQLLSLMMLVLALGLALPSGALAYTASSDEDELSEMTLVAESENRALYLDESGAVLRLVDLASGVAVDTKLMDGDSGNDNYKANQKSDFIITYWDNSSGTKTSSATTQTNYTMAIASGQVEYEEIANGIRVTYTLKEDKLTMDCVPKYITQERMEELVFAYLTTDERDFLLDYYRLYDGYYTRTKDGSSGITQSTIATIQSLFFETGAYTDEDLTYDNESFGYESTWDNMQITVSMEYTLDGDDQVIRLALEDGIGMNDHEVSDTDSELPTFV
ncbi:MAG: hypothetical protein LUF30_08580, partial [Lachnospiraceae bacterium]|nr:hypothetical protein [Lachnospiraceae bacterium]